MVRAALAQVRRRLRFLLFSRPFFSFRPISSRPHLFPLSTHLLRCSRDGYEVVDALSSTYYINIILLCDFPTSNISNTPAARALARPPPPPSLVFYDSQRLSTFANLHYRQRALTFFNIEHLSPASDGEMREPTSGGGTSGTESLKSYYSTKNYFPLIFLSFYTRLPDILVHQLRERRR